MKLSIWGVCNFRFRRMDTINAGAPMRRISRAEFLTFFVLGVEHNNATERISAKYCQEGNVMGSLVTNASPFLFPCTIEYSLICAVILFEMWKKVKTTSTTRKPDTVRIYEQQQDGKKDERFVSHFNFSKEFFISKSKRKKWLF